MKILTAVQVREADAFTIANEPISSVDLMERAAGKCFNWLVQHYGKNRNYKIFCGTGNNGGDGLVIARLLAEKNIPAETFIVRFSDKSSEDFITNHQRLLKIKKIKITDIATTADIPVIAGKDIVVDAILGSGLSKPLTGGIAADVVEAINKSTAEIVAVDIPSGLFGEDNSDNNGKIIQARQTLTFQFPKLSFLFAGNEKYAGNWHVLPIGLHPDFIEKTTVNNYFVEEADCRAIIKPRSRFSHKGMFGHALLVCGSYGKMGAAVLAAHACIKSGAGLVTSHIPKAGYKIMQCSLPEIMCSIDEDKHVISGNIDLDTYNAVGVGPGIGTDDKTQKAMKLLIQNCISPLVFDADAINILAENKTWLSFVPKKSIFTPHPKEFERLAGKSNNEYQRQALQTAFSKKYGVYVALKGAYSCISTPAGDCYFNSTGNPGMATAGSGDVLTGIITGLLAQKYTPFDACILGVYVHGLAGDLSAKRNGYEATTAGEIIKMLGKAFKKLY
ncbi:MAG TPA: NAD(P)H-hydrate dehydratase [Bacteroidales bacterium]|nr:NAD(P)H-hydrate dehydratase [Bacteroidales bacterium]HOH83076.1 NAD(P)H-hydrate dehydratase [Bacteroidales bacterium]